MARSPEIILHPKEWVFTEPQGDVMPPIRQTILYEIMLRFPHARVSYSQEFGLVQPFSGDSYVQFAPYYVRDEEGKEHHFATLAYVLDMFRTIPYPVKSLEFFRYLLDEEHELQREWLIKRYRGEEPLEADPFGSRNLMSRRIAKYLVSIHWPLDKLHLIRGLSPEVGKYYSGFMDPDMLEHVSNMLPLTTPDAITPAAKKVLEDNARRNEYLDTLKLVSSIVLKETS